MLEALVAAANFIKTTIFYALYGSCKMGNVLVTCISVLLNHLSKFTEHLMVFFSVLCQSFSIFFQDNLQFLQELFAFVGSGFDSIYTTIYFMVSKIAKLLSATVNLVLGSYEALTDLLTTTCVIWIQLVTILKKFLIMCGLGVWFLITLVPLMLYYICKFIVTSIQTIYNEIIDICNSGALFVVVLVKNFILFVFDVPLESLAGLFIGISFLFIIRQMYTSLAFFIKNKVRAMRNYWYQRQQVSVRREDTNSEPAQLEIARTLRSTTRQISDKDATENSEIYCIICQENTRCILLLPCRHLCLCQVCVQKLKMYNKSCPICRTGFSRTMKIYI